LTLDRKHDSLLHGESLRPERGHESHHARVRVEKEGASMARFLLAYHGGGMPESEEEQARVMAAWGAWFQSAGGAIADPGNPVSESRTIAADGSVSHGGGANPVSGYSLLEAESLDAAVAIAKGCPVLQGGATIEVAETFNAM
jgi:hypothetical protein